MGVVLAEAETGRTSFQEALASGTSASAMAAALMTQSFTDTLVPAALSSSRMRINASRLASMLRYLPERMRA